MLIRLLIFGLLLPRIPIAYTERLTVAPDIPEYVICGGEFCVGLDFVTDPGICGAAFTVSMPGVTVTRVECPMPFTLSHAFSGDKLVILLDSADPVALTGRAVNIYCTAERDAEILLTSADRDGAWGLDGNIGIDVIGGGSVRTAYADRPHFAGCFAGEVKNGYFTVYAAAVCRLCAEVDFYVGWEGVRTSAISAVETFRGVSARDFGGDLLLIAEVGLLPADTSAELTVTCGDADVFLSVGGGKIRVSER